MATSYSLAFDFKVSALKLTAKKTYDDGARSPSSVVADLLSKIPNVSLSSESDNTALTGADAGVAAVYDVAAAGTTTIDLSSLTTLDDQTAQALARVKFVAVMLLPTAKGGTACSGVEIGNAATNANTLWMGAATHTTLLENGDWLVWGKGPAVGKAVDATHKSILVTCTDAVVAGKVLVVIVGGKD